MFADNQMISGRQCARLLFFDFLGIGTLLLPGYLADVAGEDGIFAIAFGVAASLLYLKLLQKIVLSREETFLSGAGGGIAKAADGLLIALYGLYYVLLGGYALYLFGTLIQRTLLVEESFWLITLLGLVLAVYGMARGMECRARVYEVLFWLVLIPFLLMLLLAVADVSPQQQFPMATAAPGDVLQGAYLVFLVFSLCQMLLFAGNVISPEKAGRAAGSAILFAGLLFAVLYEILLGVFGRVTVSELEFPAVSLMSMVTLPGGFLHRQDALMVGVWFFTLFALICSSMYYSCQCMEKFRGKSVLWRGIPVKKWILLLCGVLVYAVSYGCYLHPETFAALLERFFWYLTPVYLLIPFLRRLLTSRRGRKRAKGALAAGILCLCVGLNFSGCSVVELEDRSFPMLIALDEAEDGCRLIYKFQDLSEVTSGDSKKNGGSEQDVSGGSFYEAMERYQEENGKYMDLNHVKVILLGRAFLENDRLYEDFLTVLADSPEISKNILVFVTEDAKALTDLGDEMEENLGTYLEGMLQGNPDMSDRHQVTLGTILNDWQDGRRNLLVPHLSAEEKLPVIDGCYVISGGTPAGEISEEAGELAGIFQGKTKVLRENLSDRCHVAVEDLAVTYEFQRTDRILCRVKVTGKASQEGGARVSEERLEQYVKERLEETVGACLRERRLDLTDSFDRLSLFDRELAVEYQGRMQDWQESLVLDFDVDLDLVE